MVSHAIRLVGAILLCGITVPGTFVYLPLNYSRPASSYSQWGK